MALHMVKIDTPAASSPLPRILTRHGMQEPLTLPQAKLIAERSYDPNDWVSLLNHASACYLLGYDDLALSLTLESTRLCPSASGYINLCVIYSMQGRYADAFLSAQQAYVLEPDNRTAATIYAENLLRMGRWPEAWPLFHNYYDQARVSLFSLALPEWQSGDDLSGKRVLVVEGGGYGDNFFFLRYLPRLKELGATLTYLCPASMASLMRRQPYIADVIPTSSGQADAVRIDNFDYYTPLLSLAGKFAQTAFWPTAPVSYVFAHPDVKLHRTLRIGFCPLAAEAGNLRPFRSLTRKHVGLFREAFKGHEYVVLVPSDGWLKNWLETAKWISSCDLIITVDTGVAHLAGALGVRTWVLLPGFSAWYYLIGTSTHPLYPDMTLFRNTGMGIDHAVESCLATLANREARA